MSNLKAALVLVVLLTSVHAAWANKADQILVKMSEPQQASMLAKFVRMNAQNCPRGTRALRRGAGKNDVVTWSVQCSPTGGDWMIQIDRPGKASILSCGIMDAVSRKTGECWRKF